MSSPVTERVRQYRQRRRQADPKEPFWPDLTGKLNTAAIWLDLGNPAPDSFVDAIRAVAEKVGVKPSPAGCPETISLYGYLSNLITPNHTAAYLTAGADHDFCVWLISRQVKVIPRGTTFAEAEAPDIRIPCPGMEPGTMVGAAPQQDRERLLTALEQRFDQMTCRE